MRGPTYKQAGLLGFIARFVEREGLPPTLVDMRAHLGAKSPTAALDMLKSLERKGYVRRRPRVSRGATLTDKGREYLQQLAERNQLA